MFDALSLCMTRSDPSDLYPFDAEIDNTFHRLCKHDRNRLDNIYMLNLEKAL